MRDMLMRPRESLCPNRMKDFATSHARFFCWAISIFSAATSFAPNPALAGTILEGNEIEVFGQEQFQYDSNIYRLPSGVDASSIGSEAQRDERISITTAGAEAQWMPARQVVSAYLRLDRAKYLRNSSLTNTSGVGSVSWQWILSSFLQGDVGGDYSRSLAGFANSHFFGRDLVDTRNYFADARFRFATHWKFNAGVRQTKASHSLDTRRIDDFHTKAGNAGVEYETGENNAFGFDYRYTTGTFAAPILLGDSLYYRDYHDNIERVYARYAPSGRTLIDASVGYLQRTYQRSDFGAFSGNIWRGTLHWQWTGKTQLVMAAWRDLTAYIDAQSDYFVSRGESISPTWNPTEKLAVALTASWVNQNYIGSSTSVIEYASRSDHARSQQLTISYLPRNAISAQLMFKHEYRESTVYDFSYNDKIVLISLTASF